MSEPVKVTIYLEDYEKLSELEKKVRGVTFQIDSVTEFTVWAEKDGLQVILHTPGHDYGRLFIHPISSDTLELKCLRGGK